MNTLNALLAAVVFGLLCLPRPAPAADALEDCIDSVEVTSDCLGRRQREAMRRLEQARAEARALAERRDEELGNGTTLATLLAAERAFDDWLEANCAALVLLGRGHLQIEPEYLERACKIDLLGEHADALETLVSPRD
jgi:hypothetical protein